MGMITEPVESVFAHAVIGGALAEPLIGAPGAGSVSRPGGDPPLDDPPINGAPPQSPGPA